MRALDHELEPFQLKGPAYAEISEYLDSARISRRNDIAPLRIDAWAESHDPPRRKIRLRTIDFLVGINQRLSEDIKYLIRMEPGVQTPEETLDEEAAAPAATRPGCSASSFGIADWPRGLSAAI